MNIEIHESDVRACPYCGFAPVISIHLDAEFPYTIKCDNEDYHGHPANIAERSLNEAIDEWNNYVIEHERRRGVVRYSWDKWVESEDKK